MNYFGILPFGLSLLTVTPHSLMNGNSCVSCLKDNFLLETVPYTVMTQSEQQQRLPRCFDLSAPLHVNPFDNPGENPRLPDFKFSLYRILH